MLVALEGAERMKQFDMSVTYGAFIQMNAVDGMITLGRWDEALEIAEAAEPISRGNGRIFTNIQLARIHTSRGNIEAARRALDHAAHKLARPTEAQFSGPLAGTGIELSLLLGEIAPARVIVDDVGPILEQTEDLGTLAWFLARAVRVEAEAAERARAARDEVAAAEAVRRGEAFVGRLTAIEADAVPNGYREMIRLATLFGVGEGTRVAGRSDPSAWAEAVAAADARPLVYESAYARFRHGEALLAARGPREEAAVVLARGRATADQLGALPLVEAIDGLAARARLPLGEGVDRRPGGYARRGPCRRLRADRPGAGSAAAGGGRADQPADRRGAVHQREHGRRPRLADPCQVRRRRASRGGDDRRQAGPRRLTVKLRVIGGCGAWPAAGEACRPPARASAGQSGSPAPG